MYPGAPPPPRPSPSPPGHKANIVRPPSRTQTGAGLHPPPTHPQPPPSIPGEEYISIPIALRSCGLQPFKTPSPCLTGRFRSICLDAPRCHVAKINRTPSHTILPHIHCQCFGSRDLSQDPSATLMVPFTQLSRNSHRNQICLSPYLEDQQRG